MCLHGVDGFCSSLAATECGNIIVWDVLLSGFGLQVTDRGLRNFLVGRYIRGKALRVTQGPRPEVARKEAVSTEIKQWALEMRRRREERRQVTEIVRLERSVAYTGPAREAAMKAIRA
jgi:hypothetical protein